MWSPRDTRRGQTFVEYALIVALISVALIISMTALSSGIGDVFNTILSGL